jgi:hypothetical protein
MDNLYDSDLHILVVFLKILQFDQLALLYCQIFDLEFA